MKFVPGPGTYDLNVGMNKTGSYFLSKFMGSMCRTHYHADRNTLLTANSVQTPGPGNYRLPSDFGYYESKKKSATQENFGKYSSAPISRMGKSASQPQL
jgi:hypothetical protein